MNKGGEQERREGKKREERGSRLVMEDAPPPARWGGREGRTDSPVFSLNSLLPTRSQKPEAPK
eukprot:scaffold209558_cov14-Tisochrysis_lutea.AAC.1